MEKKEIIFQKPAKLVQVFRQINEYTKAGKSFTHRKEKLHYESKPYVEGAIYFDLTDYRTHYPGTSEKNEFRRRVHGIYDMYGNPKPSMKVLREMSLPVEVQNVNQINKQLV